MVVELPLASWFSPLRVLDNAVVDLSASRFSRAPKSVLLASDSDSKPDRRSKDSIRPSRFSKPSIYFALARVNYRSGAGNSMGGIPLWRISLLLDLSKHTFRLVVYAMRAFWHSPIAFYFLFPTHITGLDGKLAKPPEPPLKSE